MAVAGKMARVVVVVVVVEEEEQEQVLLEGRLTEADEYHWQQLLVHELESAPLANA